MPSRALTLSWVKTKGPIEGPQAVLVLSVKTPRRFHGP